MITVEKVREWIIHDMLNTPALGKNYIDWHTENPGECGVTLMFPGDQKFDIIIRKK